MEVLGYQRQSSDQLNSVTNYDRLEHLEAPRSMPVAPRNNTSPKISQTTEKQNQLEDSSVNSTSTVRAHDTAHKPKPHGRCTKMSWLRRAWTLHFFLGIVVLIAGTLHNHESRKYVPMDPKRMGIQCDKAFLDVFAESETEEDSLVCCNFTEGVFAGPALCPSQSPALPFSHRLARFPDAWLLPLFPIILRILYWLYQTVSVLSSLYRRMDSDSSANEDPTAAVRYTARRLFLYVVIMNFRGWFLYVALNRVESHFVPTHDDEVCWYGEFLSREQTSCYGRAFDFSDHVVLYYAQILPIALTETLYAFQYPYWRKSAKPPSAVFNILHSEGGTNLIDGLLPVVLVVAHLYLQLITALGAYMTASYFHTGGEVLAGYAVSLLVALPLALCQCGNRSPWVSALRSFFFCYP